jgi:hypothetical protein
VELGAGEALHLGGKCMIDGKPGRAIGVISLLHKKATVQTSFSAWAEADKDGSFAVDVKFSKTITFEETFVAGALCVSKDSHHKHEVIKGTLRCVWPKHPKPPVTKTVGTVPPEVTTTTEAPEMPTETEVEKVIETEAAPKITAAPTAVKATPKFTG